MVLLRPFGYRMGRRPSPAEVRSWERSLVVLSGDLFRLWAGQRGDADRVSIAEDICILPGQGERLRPIEQVRRYCATMSDFIAVVSADPSSVSGVAYSHNATDLGVADLLGARLAAGYCWEWSDPVPGGLEVDVTIGDWHKPWNNKKDTTHAGAPGTPFWASDPAGFEQVGCVYTAQGFEYDYAGVIIGDDFVWRDDHWVARPEHGYDSQAKRGTPDQFDRAIRNTYKVLLTRGMRGVGIMSTGPETQRLLTSLLQPR